MKDLAEHEGDWIIEDGKPQELEGVAVIEQRLTRRMETFPSELFYAPAFGSKLTDALHAESLQSYLNELALSLENDEAVKEVELAILQREPLQMEATVTLFSQHQITLSL